MTYTNADARADLKHAKDTLEPALAKRAGALLTRLSLARADAECTNKSVHAFFREVTDGHQK